MKDNILKIIDKTPNLVDCYSYINFKSNKDLANIELANNNTFCVCLYPSFSTHYLKYVIEKIQTLLKKLIIS